jgi:hypothetical protein
MSGTNGLNFHGSLSYPIVRLLPDFQRAEPTEWKRLEFLLLCDIDSLKRLVRPLRCHPGLIKGKASKFDPKRAEHAHPPQFDKEKAFRDIILLI